MQSCDEVQGEVSNLCYRGGRFVEINEIVKSENIEIEDLQP